MNLESSYPKGTAENISQHEPLIDNLNLNTKSKSIK